MCSELEEIFFNKEKKMKKETKNYYEKIRENKNLKIRVYHYTENFLHKQGYTKFKPFTIVAIYNIIEKTLSIGFSKLHPKDKNYVKKIGLNIALNRAIKNENLVLNKIDNSGHSNLLIDRMINYFIFNPDEITKKIIVLLNNIKYIDDVTRKQELFLKSFPKDYFNIL